MTEMMTSQRRLLHMLMWWIEDSTDRDLLLLLLRVLHEVSLHGPYCPEMDKSRIHLALDMIAAPGLTDRDTRP